MKTYTIAFKAAFDWEIKLGTIQSFSLASAMKQVLIEEGYEFPSDETYEVEDLIEQANRFGDCINGI